MRQVLVDDEPVLMPAVADDAARDWSFAGSSSADDVLTFLDMAATEFADAVARVPADAWTRTGTVAGSGQRLRAIDILREAVRTGADHLRAAERLIPQ